MPITFHDGDAVDSPNQPAAIEIGAAYRPVWVNRIALSVRDTRGPGGLLEGSLGRKILLTMHLE